MTWSGGECLLKYQLVNFCVVSIFWVTTAALAGGSQEITSGCEKCSPWQSQWSENFEIPPSVLADNNWTTEDPTKWLSPRTSTHKNLWLKTTLSHSEIDQSLFLVNPRKAFTVWVNNQKIYSYGTVTAEGVSYPGEAWHLVPLPFSPENQNSPLTVILSLASDDSYLGFASGIRLGDPKSHLQWYSRKQMPQLAFAVLYFFGGLLILGLSLNSRLRSTFSTYGIFFILLSGHAAVRTQLPLLIYGNPALWNDVKLLFLYLLPAFGMATADRIFSRRPYKIISILKWAGAIFAAYVTIMLIAFDKSLLGYYLPFSVLSAANIITVLGLTTIEVARGNRRIWLFSLGLLSFVITATLDLAGRLGLITTPEIFQYGVFVFAVTVAIYMTIKLKLAVALIHNFRVLIPPSLFNSILRDPDLLAAPPQQRRISVIFIDLVGYSRLLESRDTGKSFAATKAQLETFVAIIHKFGGVVEKTLGDGLLAYFGFELGSAASRKDYEQSALQAAIDVQRQVAQATIDAHPVHLVHPVRIGINTDVVTIGNIGGPERFELSALGPGVVIAQRFEQAADPFRIIVDQETMTALLAKFPDCGIEKKQIKMKHHEAFRPAYEVDPFLKTPDLYKQCLSIQQGFHELNRVAARKEVIPQNLLVCISALGNGWIADISESGLRLNLDTFLGRGAIFEMSLRTDYAPLQAFLNEKHLNSLSAQVHWTQAVNGRYVHGCQINGLNERLRKLLYDAIANSVLSVSEETDLRVKRNNVA